MAARAHLLKVRIINSFGVILSCEATSVIVPGYSGNIGVMPSSRVLVYTLRPGFVHFFVGDSLVKRYFIFGGRFLARNDELTITTEYSLIPEHELTPSFIKARIKAAQVRVASAHTDMERQYERKILWQEEELYKACQNREY